MTKTHPAVLFVALTLLPLACSNSPKTDTATPEPSASAPPAPAPEPPKPEVKPIPAGFFAVTPQIVVKGVDEAVDFYVKNLGASKVLAIPGEGGNSIHADRGFVRAYMPLVNRYLSYRMLDVTAVKLLKRAWYDELEQPVKKGAHTALADIEESIAELAWYRDAIFRKKG